MKTFTLDELLKERFLPPVNEGYVYIMSGASYYKIGYSADPWRREEELDTLLPFGVALLNYFFSDDCRRMEQIVHRRFASKHVRGEWFDLDIEDLTEIEEIIRTHELGNQEVF